MLGFFIYVKRLRVILFRYNAMQILVLLLYIKNSGQNKRTNNDLQNTERSRIPLKTRRGLRCCGRLAVSAPPVNINCVKLPFNFKRHLR